MHVAISNLIQRHIHVLTVPTMRRKEAGETTSSVDPDQTEGAV